MKLLRVFYRRAPPLDISKKKWQNRLEILRIVGLVPWRGSCIELAFVSTFGSVYKSSDQHQRYNNWFSIVWFSISHLHLLFAACYFNVLVSTDTVFWKLLKRRNFFLRHSKFGILKTFREKHHRFNPSNTLATSLI